MHKSIERYSYCFMWMSNATRWRSVVLKFRWRFGLLYSHLAISNDMSAEYMCDLYWLVALWNVCSLLQLNSIQQSFLWLCSIINICMYQKLVWTEVVFCNVEGFIRCRKTQQSWRDTCQISKRYDHCNIQSRVFETSRDLAVMLIVEFMAILPPV